MTRSKNKYFSLKKLKQLNLHKATVLDESGLSLVYIIGKTVYMLSNDPCKEAIRKLHLRYPQNPYLPKIKKIGTTIWFFSKRQQKYLKTERVNVYKMPFYGKPDRRKKNFKHIKTYVVGANGKKGNLEIIGNDKLKETVRLLEKEMSKKGCKLDGGRIDGNVLEDEKGHLILIDLFTPQMLLQNPKKFHQSNQSAFSLFSKKELV